MKEVRRSRKGRHERKRNSANKTEEGARQIQAARDAEAREKASRVRGGLTQLYEAQE